MTDMRLVADDSVDAIWSSHNLEHLQRHEVPMALTEFVRVLKPCGLLLVTLPDLQQVAQLVIEDRLEDQAYASSSGPITPLDMIFGHTASLARRQSIYGAPQRIYRAYIAKAADRSRICRDHIASWRLVRFVGDGL